MSHLLIATLQDQLAAPHQVLAVGLLKLNQLAAGATVSLDTSGVYNWIVNNLLKLSVLVAGLGITFMGRKAQFADVGSRVGIVIIGLTVVGLSLYALAVGQSIVGLFVH